MTSPESNSDIKTSCAEVERKQLNKYIHDIMSNAIQNLNSNESERELNVIESHVECIKDVPSSASNTDMKRSCAEIKKDQLQKYVHTIQHLKINESERNLNYIESQVEYVPSPKSNTDIRTSCAEIENKQLKYVHSIVSNTKQHLELNSIESQIESVEDMHTKKLIPLENTVNTFAVKINKQDKATGPGVIFSKDGKRVFNFDEKCPPVPYCDVLNLKFMSIPRTKIFVYPTRYILNDYNESGEFFPQVLGGGEVTRKVSLKDILLILAIQLILTFSVIFICVYVQFLTNFMRYDSTLMYCIFGVGLTLYFALICYPNIRNRRPDNYFYLFLYSLCTGYLLGYIHVGYETNKLLLISLCETLIILLLVIFISWINIIDFTACFFLIETLVTCAMVFYIIASIHMWLTGRTVLMFIFFCILVPVICLLILQQFQLLLGKGKYEIQTDEDVLISLHIYLQIVILFIVLPKFIIVTPY